MSDKSIIKEIGFGIGLGLLTNIIWAAVADQFDIYVVAAIFVFVAVLYYALWRFVIKPLIVSRKVRIQTVYDNYSQAKSTIKSTMLEASNIKVISIGGSSLTEEDRGEILEILSKRILAGGKVKVLLLNPDSIAVEQRFQELNSLKTINGSPQELSKHISASAQKILSRNNSIEVRYYDTKPIWRFYIFDKIAFISFYLGEKEGHYTKVLVIERGSDLFSAVERNFNAMWDVSQIANTIRNM